MFDLGTLGPSSILTMGHKDHKKMPFDQLNVHIGLPTADNRISYI